MNAAQVLPPLAAIQLIANISERRATSSWSTACAESNFSHLSRYSRSVQVDPKCYVRLFLSAEMGEVRLGTGGGPGACRVARKCLRSIEWRRAAGAPAPRSCVSRKGNFYLLPIRSRHHSSFRLSLHPASKRANVSRFTEALRRGGRGGTSAQIVW